MKSAEDLHSQAMEFMDLAFASKRRKDYIVAQKMFRNAFDLEREAALLVVSDYSFEPTRSVLFRSAAVLALDCGEVEEAKQLIKKGLLGFPPAQIRQELEDLLKEVLVSHFTLPLSWQIASNKIVTANTKILYSFTAQSDFAKSPIVDLLLSFAA